MTDLLLALSRDWRLYLLAVLIFGFAPGFFLRLFVLLYPADDGRREELPNELYSLPRWIRPFWVAEQIETVLFEGPKARRQRARARQQGDEPEGDVDEREPAVDPALAIAAAEAQRFLLEAYADRARAARTERSARRKLRKAKRREKWWAFSDLKSSGDWFQRLPTFEREHAAAQASARRANEKLIVARRRNAQAEEALSSRRPFRRQP